MLVIIESNYMTIILYVSVLSSFPQNENFVQGVSFYISRDLFLIYTVVVTGTYGCKVVADTAYTHLVLYILMKAILKVCVLHLDQKIL